MSITKLFQKTIWNANWERISPALGIPENILTTPDAPMANYSKYTAAFIIQMNFAVAHLINRIGAN